LAIIVSAATFDITDLNFYRVTQNFYASNIYYDLNIGGTVYPNIVEVDWLNNGQPYAAIFAGSGILLDANHNIIAGTVTGYLEAAWNGSTWIDTWGVTNFSTSASALYQAFLTSSTADDYAIIQSVLSGNDAIATSAGNDLLAGFEGNDIIDGGGGIDTAFYSGLRANYQFTKLSNSSLQITDLRAGSPDGTDTLTNVELFHFADITFDPSTDRAPVVSATNFTAAHGQSSVLASTLFAASDPDGDTITQYALWDSNGNGHWVVNGVTQATNAEIVITAAQLAQTSYQFGAATDQLWVRAFDGILWSAWKPFTATPFANTAPVVTASDQTVAKNATLAVSSLFSASDADGDPITAYRFWDSTADASSGHFAIGGVAEATNQSIDVSAAQLAQTTFQTGTTADDLWVQVYDGTAWSAWREFHLIPPVNHLPVVAGSDFTATHNQNIATSSLFSVSDADGDAITQYQLWDSTSDPTSGHWVVDGAARGANVAIDVTAAQLASTTFQSGSGSDDLWVRANDGFVWGAWKEFHVNAPIDNAPVVTASDFTATHNQNIAASSLFSVTDADSDSIDKFQFWDSTADPASGHWVVDGAARGANVAIDVTAAQLASTAFQGGSVPDDLWVRASDGTQWSQWHEFHWLV
jgi:hypothetical protein